MAGNCSPPSSPPKIYFPFASGLLVLGSADRIVRQAALSFPNDSTPSSRSHVDCIVGWDLKRV